MKVRYFQKKKQKKRNYAIVISKNCAPRVYKIPMRNYELITLINVVNM